MSCRETPTWLSAHEILNFHPAYRTLDRPARAEPSRPGSSGVRRGGARGADGVQVAEYLNPPRTKSANLPPRNAATNTADDDVR